MMILVFHAPLIALRSFDDSNHLTSVLSLTNYNILFYLVCYDFVAYC